MTHGTLVLLCFQKRHQYRDTHLRSTWQELLPGRQILGANNLAREGGIAQKAVICHCKYNTTNQKDLFKCYEVPAARAQHV